MSKQELENVLAMIEETRGGDRSNNPLWFERNGVDVVGMSFPMPEEPIEITQVRANGVPGLCFTPSHAIQGKVLLFMHGGGYVLGSALSHRHLVARFSIDLGITAFSIDYRMAPEYPFPAAVEDAVSAYQHLIEQGYQPKDIMVVGDSAGGGLAACLLVALKEQHLPQPGCAVLISPWLDLTQSGESFTSRADVDPLVSKESLDEFAAIYVQGGDPTSPTASPLFADLKGLAPIYIQIGDAETLLSTCETFAEKAIQANVDVKLDCYPNMIHIWPYFWPMLSEGMEACQRIAQYGKEKLNIR